MLDLMQKLYKIYRPYFGFSGKNFKRSIVASLMLVFNIVAAFLLMAINTAFTALMGVLMEPGVTYTAFFGGVGQCFWVISLYVGILTLNYIMSSWLGLNLRDAMNNSLIKKWTDSKAFYGIKFLSKEKKLNAATVLMQDVEAISKTTTSLADSFVHTGFGFCVGLYCLWVFSAGLSISFFSFAIPIPGYMALGALVYAVSYYNLIERLGRPLTDLNKKVRNKTDKLMAHLHHVEMHGESIALKGGALREKKALLQKLKSISRRQTALQIAKSLLSLVEAMHGQLNFVCGLILAAPGVIKGKLVGSEVFSIAGYFSRVVSFFTWESDHVQETTALAVSLERLEKFTELMQAWEQVIAKSDVQTIQNGQDLTIKNYHLETPEGKVIANDLNMTFPKGEVTLLQGPSGIGKSTLLLSLANLWPYVKGDVALPAASHGKPLKTYYIPQKPHFAYEATLLESITYPNVSKVSKKARRQIKDMMRAFGIEEKIIKKMRTKKDWGKVLSGGEQQRIAIIGAIYQNPDILFMDEATNALDYQTKEKVENYLKQHLPNTTIVDIDHNAQKESKKLRSFFQKVVVFSKESQNREDAQDIEQNCPRNPAFMGDVVPPPGLLNYLAQRKPF